MDKPDGLEEMPRYGIDALDAHGYTDEKRSGLPGTYAGLIQTIVSRQSETTPGVFVDVGAGRGELVKYLQENGIASLGLDYSPVGIAENRKAAIVADAALLPLKEKSAAVIHIKDVIEHFDDVRLEQFITGVKRVLVEGGILILTETNYGLGTGYDQRQMVSVHFPDGKKWQEETRWGESYARTVSRLERKYSERVKIGVPYFVRSVKQILETIEGLGLKHTAAFTWKAGNDEPDWFNSHPVRNVMVFKLPKPDFTSG
jgi:SAM-dependent methyltransferase